MKLKVLRLISLLMVAMLSLTLFAGCGGGSDSSDVSGTGSDGVAAMDDVDIDLNLGGSGEDGDGNGAGGSSGSSGGNAGSQSSGITQVDNTDIFENIPKKLRGTTVIIAHWGDEGASEYVKVQKKFTSDTGIKVKWVLLNESEYISSIVKQIAAGSGPDIRLTYLVPELQEFVDKGQMKMRPAVELSYLDEETQRDIVDRIDETEAFPSHDQAIRIRKAYEAGEINYDKVSNIMSEEKPNQKPKFRFSFDRLKPYIPKDYTDSMAEDYVIKALEHYQKYLKKQREQAR